VTSLVLRSNALLDAVLGIFLLAGTWNALYEAIDVPHPDPAVYAQIAGAFALGFAYLLWIAPRNTRLTQAVAAGRAFVNGFAALIGVVWLVREGFDGPAAPGSIALVGLAAAYAVAEGWLASRSVAMLVPGD
jgi:hypothetical protein